LAAQQGSELQFDRYRRLLDEADLTPQLRATYLLYVGRGYGLLHKHAIGIPYLEEAVAFAAEHRLNQLMFEAEAALTDSRQARRTVTTTEWIEDTSELQDIVHAIHSMKASAGVD